MHPMIDKIERVSNQILGQSPGVVVRYRLLRDVHRKPADDSELQQAYDHLKASQQIHELTREQWQDGSWGAFHSRNSKRKQKIPSTEVGVERALALGLDASHPVLAKAAGYILKIMEGEITFPDYHEKNNRWATGMRLFLASTLSLIQPDHSVLNSDRKLWREIANQTFQSGKYDQESEIRAHAKLTGAAVKDSYLVLSNRYQLNILGSMPGMLSRELEEAILRWLWTRADGIGYLGIPLHSNPPEKPGPIDRWLASLEIMARGFPSWVNFAPSAIEWLWECQTDQGYWDFGPRPSSISNLPLSDNWRQKAHREFDWTTRVLILLRKYYDGAC